ncbi:protein PFC0760c-like [Aricia agestis]|uniref:protein PFC0760c-like n=1 Tax=Aricia agestis TaxID=91739 RepID=UPI001C203BA6|nr:protein PFC0760c-like [Aricia agestis]
MEEDIGKKINNFEKILKTYCVSKSLLYRDKINEKESQGLRSEDVIKNISKQIKALNYSETLSKTVNNKLKTYKESRLTSINSMFSLELEPQQNHPVASNFENQWGFDTQLIVATKDAEALKELHTGVTQEFETSFDQKPEIIYSQGKVNIDNKSCSKSKLKINISSPHQILQDTVLNNCNLSHLGNEESNNDNAIDDCNLQDLVLECDTISSSPILFSKNEKECHNTSILLESFEKFEAIAAPIVYENSDVEAVKKIINLKLLHNNQAQVTSEEIQYEDKHYETASIHLSPILKLKTDQEVIMSHINCHLSNKGDFLDEDIIFSSDEKTENDYNEVEELPLTCALQTSFYEQESDLDKTIYVGFQTASNKSIQVLTNSFTKAKSILNDCYKISKPIQSLSLSELVEVYDSATIEKKGDYKSQKTSFDTGCGTKENVFNSSFHNNDKEHKPLKFSNFDDSVLLKTNKAVICTQEQIKIDDYMMQEFEENMCINDNKLHTNSDVSKHPVIFNRAEEYMLNDNTNAHSDYCSIPISTSNNEQNKTSLEEKLIENSGMDDGTMYQNNYERDKMNKNENVKNELLTGFKTASNKCINISKASLLKSKEILEEVNIESNLTTANLHSKMVKNKKFQGFSTASSKPIKISDKAYVESDKIFQSNKFPLVMNENQNYNNKETTENTQNNRQIFEIEHSKIDTHSGFKTASNNSVHVSKDALLIAKKFLQEFNFDNYIVINNKKELVSEKETLRLIKEGSYTDSNNPTSVSEEDFDNTKNNLEEFRLKKNKEKNDKVGTA